LSSENNPTESDAKQGETPAERSGDAAPDRQPASGVLQGDVGTEAAQVWIGAFLIAALGFVVYLFAFSIPLHGDDLALFGQDASMGRLVTCLESLPHMPGAPLSVVGLSLNAIVGGGNIDALHGGSILLHLLCGILLFLIARRILPPGTPEAVAMLAGLLFVAHPLASESVNYLIARPVLQSAFFGLSGLVLLLRGCAPQRHRVICIAAAVVCFALAFGSDAAALYFPLIGIGLVYFRGVAHGESGDFRGVVAAALLLSVAFMWTAGHASGLLAATAAGHGMAAGLRALIAQAGYALYYGAMPQAYSLLPVSGGMVTGVAALLLIAAVVGFGLARKGLAAVLGFWILAALAGAAFLGPAEGVGPTRYLYMPWAALCIAVPWGLQVLGNPRARLIGGAAAAIAILALSAVTFQRCGLWTRPADLWAAEGERHPESPVPARAAGRYLLSQVDRLGANEENRRELLRNATALWNSVLEREPDSAEARKSLGILALEEQKFDEALEHLRHAAARRPQEQELALFIAFAAEQQARVTGDRRYAVEAVRSLERARQLAPLPLPALERYGILAAQRGDLATGLAMLEHAEAQGSTSLAEPIAQFKSLAEQAEAFNQQAEAARREAPQSPAALFYRAQRNLLEGRLVEAHYLLQAVMAMDSTNPGAWSLLGYACARLDGAENFLNEWGNVTGNWENWIQLATRCGAGGLWTAAEVYLRHGAEKQPGEKPLPEMGLAEVATALNQPQRAVAYLQAAQQAHPDNPAPWLRLAEMALEAGETAQARSLAGEAEKRNADPEAVKKITDQVGGASPVREGITRTVIQ